MKNKKKIVEATKEKLSIFNYWLVLFFVELEIGGAKGTKNRIIFRWKERRKSLSTIT
jgi:hypothetical protein